MTTAAKLWRADLEEFSGYKSARSEFSAGATWLNANESPWANSVDPNGACRRYPDPQPAALISALADLYKVNAQQILVGRGSDEGIDLLVRAFCMPNEGKVVIAPPVFGMYAVCARLQGAQVIEVPLLESGTAFKPDLKAIGETALQTDANLVFLCSPGNPTGEAIPLEQIEALAASLNSRCILVVDEAYGEFSDTQSSIELLKNFDNVVVLRTLSKAHALAGARIGCVLAHPTTIEYLRRCQAPYPIPQPVVDLALAAVAKDALADTRSKISQIRESRNMLFDVLRRMPGVLRVYPSQANFFLLRLEDADAVLEEMKNAGIVVRDMRGIPRLSNALRITVGDAAHNAAVVSALTRAAQKREVAV